LKSIFTLFVFILFLFSATGCQKEKLDADSLTGIWQYDKVQFTGNEADTIVNISGKFTFQKSTGSYNAGGTVYGESIAGSGDFPSLNENLSGPASLGKIFIEFKLTNTREPANYNYMNFYTGSYGYLYQGLNYYADIRMCMISKDEVNVQFQISQNSGVRFNIKSMVLKKVNG
jgi:hypothetical protein